MLFPTKTTKAATVRELQEHARKQCSETDYWQKVVGADDHDEAVRLANEFLTDEEQLSRILVARKYKLQASTDLLLEQVAFRAKWRPQSITPGMISNALQPGVVRPCGYSKEGSIVADIKAVLWNPNQYGNGDSSSGTDAAVDEFIRFVCFILELLIGKMKDTEKKGCFIFNLAGFDLNILLKKNVRRMIDRMIYVVQAQYPERLKRVYIVAAPQAFNTIWTWIKTLLDERTADKVRFCTSTQLQEDIDISVLTKEYGGTHDEYPKP